MARPRREKQKEDTSLVIPEVRIHSYGPNGLYRDGDHLTVPTRWHDAGGGSFKRPLIPLDLGLVRCLGVTIGTSAIQSPVSTRSQSQRRAVSSLPTTLAIASRSVVEHTFIASARE